MIQEHERVVLTTPVLAEGLEAGDVGTVVHIYRDGHAYEVEFVTLDGRTAAVVTLDADQVRPVNSRETPQREFKMNSNEYVNVLRELPGNHYVAEFINDHGHLRFLSDALRQLLGYEPRSLDEFFLNDHERDHALIELRCPPECVTSGQVYLSRKDGSPLYVNHQARMIRPQNQGAGGVILGTVTSLESDFALQEELNVYRKLLHRLKAGVHVIERPRDGEDEARIIWMNDFEANLLRIDTSRLPRDPSESSSDPLHPSDLMMPEDHVKREEIKSVSAKFSGNKPATDMRPREYCEKNPDGESRPIPVRIKDYFIASNPRNCNPGGRPTRIVTLVLPLALPSKLVQFLTEKGARAPVLEQLGVRSFEKHMRGGGHPIQFRFLNKLFRRDNRPNDQEWEQLQARKGVALGSDDDLIWDELIDKAGLSDSDLYPIQIADRFNADDTHVFESGSKPLQGVEPHPKAQTCELGEQHAEVQFLKIPLVENGLTVGLSGFYWPIEETDSIVAKLLHILEKEREEVLNDLPDLFHVIRKNGEKKFEFVNRRQALEHGKPQSEFIGKTDIEVFEFDKALAKNYEKDDERVLGGHEVARYEPHRSSETAEVRQVLTIKSPIHGPTGKPNGIQCIYWYSDELDDLLRRTQIADGVAPPKGVPDAKAQLFVSYARKNRTFLVGSSLSTPPISGFVEALEVLQSLHRVRYWFDELRSEDVLNPEIGMKIQASQIFILFLSPAFFESNYIREVELPLIQARKLSDPTVRILPILVQPVDYQDSPHQIVTWLRSIPTFNEGNGKWRHAVEALVKDGKEHEFWLAVSKKIRTLLGGLVD